jgi:hypothetical protein
MSRPLTTPGKIELCCTEGQHHGLLVACDKVRKGTKSVTVDRQALMNLLIDQGRLLRALPQEKLKLPD